MSVTHITTDYRRATSGVNRCESTENDAVENVDRGRPDCCAELPLNLLFAVTYGTCTFVVCKACAADCALEALATYGAVNIRPYLDWLFS